MHEKKDLFSQPLSVGDQVLLAFTNIDDSSLYPSCDLVVGIVEDLSFTIGDTIKVRSTKTIPGRKTVKYDTCLVDSSKCVKISLVD